MIRAHWSLWCEGCLHPIDADDPHIVLATKHIPDFDHEVLFHRGCFFPGHPLYTEIPGRSGMEVKSPARQPRPPRGTRRRRSARSGARGRERQLQVNQVTVRRDGNGGSPKSTALLEIRGSDGSARTVPCRTRFGAPWVSVQLCEDVVLERGISYRMVLLREDGAPVEGVVAFEADSGLLRPVSVSSLGFLFDSSKGAEKPA